MRPASFLFGLAFLVASSSAVVSVDTVTDSPVVNGRPLYKFAYAVNDLKTGDIKSVREERDGDLTRGFYSLLQPDGIVRTVVYDVTPLSGYRAHVSNAPGPIIRPVILSELPVSVVTGVNIHAGAQVNKIVPGGPVAPPPPPPPPPPSRPPTPPPTPVAQAIGHGGPVVIPLGGGPDHDRFPGFRPSPLVGNPHGINGFRPVPGNLAGVNLAALGHQGLRAHGGHQLHGPRGHPGLPIFSGFGGPVLGGVRPEGLRNVVGGIGPILPGGVNIVGPVNPGGWVTGQRGVGQPFTIGNWAGGVGGTGVWGHGPIILGHHGHPPLVVGHHGHPPLVVGHHGIPGVWARGLAPIVGANPALLRGRNPGVGPGGVHWGGPLHGVPLHRSGIPAESPATPSVAPGAKGTK